MITEDLTINGAKTTLQAGDLIGLSKQGNLSFMRAHIPIESASQKIGLLQGITFEDFISLLEQKGKGVELFGVPVKKRHTSPDGNVVYFMVQAVA